ncbi:olfactory receptor 11L1-like [Pelobates fuscus]|uniref:olfactory receptor 11L1-like n=1 Tax=Pelobates fuscus TaxID=191477 RepID=UPI002FE4430B
MGFQNLHNFKIPFFILLFKIYIMTISANFLIVLLVSISTTLHTPMYFFLSHLSLCDMLFSTSIIPKMLHIVLEEGGTISLNACFIQIQIFGSCCIAECYLLTVMSYDRYVAICNPLLYSSIVDVKLCTRLVIISWMLGFLFALIACVLVGSLDFCNHNIIDHFFCDFIPVLELSCSDTSIAEMESLLVTPFILLFPFLFVFVTYVHIFFTIFGISSTTGRQKTFSTCGSHLTVVSLFYGTLLSIYYSPSRGYVLNINKFVSLFYTVFTPLFNPIIYSLRNKEIRKACYICLRVKQI